MRLNTLFAAGTLLVASQALAAGQTVDYQVNGEDFQGYYTSPAENAPLVILIHDWDGLTDYEVKRADMLAEMGYAVFAVDLFGTGVRPTETEHKKLLTGNLYKDRDKLRALLNGSVEQAASLGGNTANAVTMGYCFGGAAALDMARSGAEMKGFATFHGGLKTPEGQDYSQAKGKVLVLHGTADQAIPMSDFAQLADEMEQAGVAHQMVTYSGAPHAFTVFGSSRYQEVADQKSWQEFQVFLDDVLQ